MARTLRTEAKLDPRQQLTGTVYCRTVAIEIVQRHLAAIERLANVKLALKSEAAPKAPAIRSTPEFDLILEVPEGQQDAQRKRVDKEIDQLRKNITSLERQLSDEKFLGKAPANIVEGMRRKLEEYKSQLRKYE